MSTQPSERPTRASGKDAPAKSKQAFRTISEVAEDLDLPQHVLRFWETRFNQIKPLKRGGNRRYYRPDDIDLLRVIQHLLYTEGYTIKGVQKLFRDQGLKVTVRSCLDVLDGQASAPAPVSSVAPGSEEKAPTAAVGSDIRGELAGILAELQAMRRLLDDDS